MARLQNWCVCSFLFLSLFPAQAQEAVPVDGAVYTARLSQDMSAGNLSMGEKGGTVTFKTLPPDYPANAATGAISIGEAKGDFIGFAYDKNSQRIWIDANRNLDLADDPPVLIDNMENDYGITYRGVAFDMPGEPARHYKMDIQIYPVGMTRMTITSGWTGFVDLPTGRYPLGVTDDLNGTIGSSDAVLLGFRGAEKLANHEQQGICAAGDPSQLFVDGKHYTIAYRFEPGATGADLIVEFREAPVTMAEAAVEGQYIERMVFVGEQGTVFLDHPSGTVAVPAGSFTFTKILLNAGKEELMFESSPSRSYVFEAGKPVAIAEGAPLNNTLELCKGVFAVTAGYKLCDKTGAEYEPASSTKRSRPSFVVYKGGKQISSANFEYG